MRSRGGFMLGKPPASWESPFIFFCSQENVSYDNFHPYFNLNQGLLWFLTEKKHVHPHPKVIQVTQLIQFEHIFQQPQDLALASVDADLTDESFVPARCIRKKTATKSWS